MSDQVPASEATTGSAAAPAPSAPAVPASQVDAGAFPSFGTTRGSGLARGKRSGGASQTKPAPVAGYQPSAIQVVTPVREYVNPFGGATSVPSAEPVVEAAPAPAVPVAESAPAAPVAEVKVETPAEPEAKPELNILPPEPVQRPAQSWENTPASEAPVEASAPAVAPSPERRPRREERRDDRRGERRDDRRGERRDDARPARPSEERPSQAQGERPIFRPERRERAPQAPRPEGQAPRPEGDAPRRDFEPRRPRPVPAAAVTAKVEVTPEPKKSTGFFGWLKGLFAGGPAEVAAPVEEKRDERPRHGGGQPRQEGRHGGQRHGRGGRDRSFRNPNPQGSGPSEGSGDAGGRQDGGFRRRRRGGRGRGFRPEGRGDSESGS